MIQVRAQITTKWAGRGYVPMNVTDVQAYAIDSALDTDTDSWNLQVGDLNSNLIDMLKRDNEVRVSIYALGEKQTQALNTGFADEISMDENNIFTINGRDITAVAVDSQHPPQIWHLIRPEKLIAMEARKLKIGDRLQLDSAKGFKSYTTDGSESYWDVWYRFYRKRQKWLYAEPDASIIASGLNYTGAPAYFFGVSRGITVRANATWIPVQGLEWRADKTQRLGEIYVFGHSHHGKVGFVAHEPDPSIKKWVKKPTRIVQSAESHNYAEARVEALEELFESNVGSVEIKLTIADPGFIIRQNRMAIVNLPSVGLKGEYFVVGAQTFGSIEEGQYQIVRLREKKYAISRRVPKIQILSGGPDEGTQGTIAANLSGDYPWKDAFVNATSTYRGPWPFQVFLATLLSMCEQESGFKNVRQGGDVIYPGTYQGIKEGTVPSILQHGPFEKFANTFANEVSKGRVSQEYGVGPMQLTTPGYKFAADRLYDPVLIDEFVGGRWHPESNIMAGAAALASKLGAGHNITSDGYIRTVTPSGLSLNPTEENIWAGVQAYNGTGDAAVRYMNSVRAIYNSTYRPEVELAVQTSRTATDQIDYPSTTGNPLREAVLNNAMITWERADSQMDVRMGLIYEPLLKFLQAFTAAGFPVRISVLKSGHNLLTSEGRVSAHGAGKAVDISNYNYTNPTETDAAMKWIALYQTQLAFSQLIGPNPSLVIPLGGYDDKTLGEHKSHIHVGWAL